jgi:hypothetical protein
MRNLAAKGVAVPGIKMYNGYMKKLFLPSWLQANGAPPRQPRPAAGARRRSLSCRQLAILL